jgi:hypothetical protein
MNQLEQHLLPQLEGSRDFFWHRMRWHAVSRYLPPGLDFSLLDVGAGAGLVGVYLKEKFPRAHYSFIEPLPELERRLAHRYGHAANRKGEPIHLGVQVVTLLDVLEHQANDREFLKDLINRMPSQARLLITVPAFQFLWSAWDEKAGHARRYNKGRLMALVKECPVEVKAVFYLFPELIFFALYRKFAPSQTDLEFPRLPAVVNKALFFFSRAVFAVMRGVGFGTSLGLVLVKNVET